MIVIPNKPTQAPTEENYWLEPRPYFVYAILSSVDDPTDTKYSVNISEGNTTYDVPANLFDVVENSLPVNWEEDDYLAYGKKYHIKTFPEWAHDSSFYEKLWNDDPEVSAIFKKYADEYEQQAKNFDMTDRK